VETAPTLFVYLSKIDHAPFVEAAILRWMMAQNSEMLTREEFASLLRVGNTSAVFDPPAVISAEHSTRLIGLGYMRDLAGRLRLTTPGRLRMRAENQ
jgi:hypothetical protein